MLPMALDLAQESSIDDLMTQIRNSDLKIIALINNAAVDIFAPSFSRVAVSHFFAVNFIAGGISFYTPPYTPDLSLKRLVSVKTGWAALDKLKPKTHDSQGSSGLYRILLEKEMASQT